MSYDELELDTLGDRKTALFFIMSDTDDSFNFLMAMAFSQLFNLLCEKADNVYGGRLPGPCAGASWTRRQHRARCPGWKSWWPPSAAVRSPPVWSASAVPAQSHLQGQRRHHHRQHGQLIFLGGKEPTTLKELAECWARRPSTPTTPARAVGGKPPLLNYQKLGKELMSQERAGRHGRRQVHFAAAGPGRSFRTSTT